MFIFSRLLNSFIRKGHKQRIENYLIPVLKKIKLIYKKRPLFILSKILQNCLLMVELRHPIIRHKKKKYPYFVSYNRIKRLTLKSIMKSVKKRNSETLSGRLYMELKDAFNNKGLAVNAKKQIYDYTYEILPIIDKYGRPVSKKKRSLSRV